jgi:hypothetical protein
MKPHSLTILAACGACLSAAGALMAQPLVEFASFSQAPTLGKPFVFDNQTTSAVFNTFDGTDNSIDVTFFFHGLEFSGDYAALNGPLAATLTLTANTVTAVLPGPVQPIDAGTFVFTLAGAPINGKSVLLQVDFAGASILGLGTSGVVLASEPGYGVISFASDFISGLDASSADDFSVSLGGIFESLAISGSFLRDFVASASGVFSINGPAAPIPEPEFYAIAMVILVGVVVGLRRIRQRLHPPPA